MHGFEPLDFLPDRQRVGEERRLTADAACHHLIRRRRGVLSWRRLRNATAGRRHLGVSGVNRNGAVRGRHSHGLSFLVSSVSLEVEK